MPTGGIVWNPIATAGARAFGEARTGQTRQLVAPVYDRFTEVLEPRIWPAGLPVLPWFGICRVSADTLAPPAHR